MSLDMFHEGNLQSGIARAIQEQKLVGCFIRDDGAESTTWEDEWLKSGWLSSLLEQKAVLLRLEAGSTEAGFLSAFCTISAIPTFIVIQNGQLQEHLSSGISQKEFTNRIRKVLGASPIPGTEQSSASTVQASTLEPASTPIPTPPAEVSETSPTPPRSSKAKGKQKATPSASQPSPPVSKAQQATRDALRKKKEEERGELERIKARIEADKAERKAQAEARKAERERLTQGDSTSTTASQNLPATTTPTSARGSNAKEVHLNIRLFDGATIRSTFPRTANLQDAVRPWIDREVSARAAAGAPNAASPPPPYFFKQILAPLPSRELSAGDEAQSLGAIDLAPSATLILVPVKGYTEAYAGGAGGVVSSAASGVFGLVGGAFNLAGSAVDFVGSTLSSVLGGGPAGTSQQQQVEETQRPPRPLGTAPQEGPAAAAAGIRVRTLADQRARESRNEQLYNGNQLNFEPRNDEADR